MQVGLDGFYWILGLFNVTNFSFQTINMPLTEDALESLFERLDINDNDEIEYE